MSCIYDVYRVMNCGGFFRSFSAGRGFPNRRWGSSHYQGTPFANANSSTRPLATPRVCRPHRQPFVRTHCRIPRCPPSATALHVSALHGQPFACAHCSISRCPPFAAAQQTVRSGHPRRPPRCMRCTALKHPSFTALSSSSSLNSSPVATIVSRIARLTAGSRARSAGSSKISGCGRRRGGRGGRGWLLASQQGNSSLVETSAPQRLWS